MPEIESIGRNILRGIMLPEGVRVVAVLRNCDGFVQHGENETLYTLFVGVDKSGVAFWVKGGVLSRWRVVREWSLRIYWNLRESSCSLR